MADEHSSFLNKQQRKKQRRKEKKVRERSAHRNLDEVTSAAIKQALQLAPVLTDVGNPSRSARERLDVALASASEAQFVRKRVNDALKVDEWLDEVQVQLAESDGEVSLYLRRSL